jgi:4-aminobutyrate aminotransferase/(S)-3-amino-2-methylpropionate transaminase
LGEKLLKSCVDLQSRYEIIGDVRGLGPMMGMELVRDRDSKEPASDEAGQLVRRCYERGLIILRCGPYHNVIRILMPLVITDDQMEKGLEILEESLREIR